jgi:methylmalonyl-CoA/ethylmalonyl-CoA epimerase
MPPSTPRGTRVSHIGIAVKALSETIPFFRDVLQLREVELDDADGAKIVGLSAGEPLVELLEAGDAGSPIAKFVAKRGAGIHHICFSVDDLDAMLERKENESHFCTPGLPVGCSSSFQIIKPRSSAPGRAAVAAEVAHGGDIHVLDIPAIGWPFDRVESGLPSQIAFLQLDTNIASAALPRGFAEDARAVVFEVTGENGETLFELGVIHCVARRPIFRSPLGGHRLNVAGVRGEKELLGGELGRGGSGRWATALRGAGAGSEQNQTRNSSKFHDITLQRFRAAI